MVGMVLLAIAYFYCLIQVNYIIILNRMMWIFIAIAFFLPCYWAFSLFPGFSSILAPSLVAKEIYRAVIYAIIFEILLYSKINIKSYARVWKVIVFIIVAIAILQYIKIFDIDSILKYIYGDSSQYHNTQFTELSAFRSGSVFGNPNVLASFLVAALAINFFLDSQMKEAFISRLIKVGVILIGLILTGSRTGMLIGVIIITVYLLVKSKGNRVIFFKNIFLLLLGLACFVGVAVLFFDFDLTEIFSYRMFQVSAGTQNSLNIKYARFTNLLKHMTPWNLVLGYGPFAYTSSDNLAVDFDFGYFITYFGVIGLVLYCILLSAIYHFGDYKLAGRKFLNTVFLIIVLFFGITSGVYFNLRIFAVYLLMFIPTLYVDDKQIS